MDGTDNHVQKMKQINKLDLDTVTNQNELTEAIFLKQVDSELPSKISFPKRKAKFLTLIKEKRNYLINFN